MNMNGTLKPPQNVQVSEDQFTLLDAKDKAFQPGALQLDKDQVRKKIYGPDYFSRVRERRIMTAL